MGVPNLKPKAAWYVVSLCLLVIYLVFFHMLNAATAARIPMLGIVFGSVWMTVCFVFQTVFRNRFEFGIHMLVAVDFWAESMILEHSGYGFYYCAAAFWTVFLVYHLSLIHI